MRMARPIMTDSPMVPLWPAESSCLLDLMAVLVILLPKVYHAPLPFKHVRDGCLPAMWVVRKALDVRKIDEW
jgi:hypothetical protein